VFKNNRQDINLRLSQWWSYDQLVKFQVERMKRIVAYAYKNIEGYNEIYKKHGIHPREIRSLRDLEKLPIITREELRNTDKFANKKIEKGIRYTGGSTGKPLAYYECHEASGTRVQAHLRGWSWNGYVPGKRLAVISSAQGVINKKNTLNLVGDLTSKNLERNTKELKKFKTQHIRGYVSSLYIFALYLLEKHITVPGIESINTISENLYSHQRRTIEKAFNAPVFEEYVCNDGGASAWECSAHSKLHYCMERSIVEEVSGEVITTDLWNKATPFIRYKNGDFVKFSSKKCKCGRQLPLMKVSGRANDVLVSKKGPVSPTFLIHHGIGLKTPDNNKITFRAGIRAVQYIQKPGLKLQVNVVRNSKFTKETHKNLARKLKKILPGMEININYLKNLENTAKGKIRFIINEDKRLLRRYKANG